MYELDKPLFRFKTEQEFIEEFGDRWTPLCSYGWDNDMNFLFNKIIGKRSNKQFLALYIDVISNISYCGWTIGKDMIKPINYEDIRSNRIEV